MENNLILKCDFVWLQNTMTDFYKILGMFLSKREIVKEIGGPVWDDNGKLWIVALTKESNVVGFSGLVIHKTTAHFCSDYVIQNYRNKGIHSKFVCERIKKCNHIKVNHATATVTSKAYAQYIKAGFKEHCKIGKYTKLILSLGEQNGT